MARKALPHSVSNPPTGFERLDPRIQRWIRDQGWSELRDVQDRAIRAILDGDQDVLIAAATASGKTEAAFLPILTRVAARSERGAAALYVSPLKALINDQFRRLDFLCEALEIEVVRWHGDAPQSAKRRALCNPSGLILITPESLEALLLRRACEAQTMLGKLDYVVIDELHAFMQGPRGLQLASLLHRVDLLGEHRARRVGLSATIGDMGLAKTWLNARDSDAVTLVESVGDSPELRLQIRGVVRAPEEESLDDLEGEDGPPTALDQIANHAFEVLRGSNNLFFAGSRRSVEAVADRLRARSEKANVPNEFFPHHGSLSKALREELEERLKQGQLPTTAIATTTLELGIDIGSVKSVAQLGAPRALSSLRQRLGRSGRRRGAPAILRIYAREPYPDPDLDPLETLSVDVVQSIAATRLLLARFIEAPANDLSLFSVLLHQTLSLIVQWGGAKADKLFGALTGSGAFKGVTATDYIALLRHMASAEIRLLEQAPDGLIMLGEIGERLVSGRDFYAVFKSDEEWRLVAGGKTLGTIPISNAIGVGALLAFAGRRWRVTAVDDLSKVLEIVPHRAGKLPKFDRRSVEPMHDRLAAEMHAVYLDSDLPPYLDQEAARLLGAGREAFERLALADRRCIPSGADTHVLTWRGTVLNGLLALTLVAAGLDCEAHDLGVTIADTTPAEVQAVMAGLKEVPSVEMLSEFAANLREAKYDEFVPEGLLRSAWVRAHYGREADLTALLAELASAVTVSG